MSTPADDAQLLPVDPDLGAALGALDAPPVARSGPRPVHLRWSMLGLVFLGSAVGTTARFLIEEAVPPVQGLPVATLGINVTGAFLLGLLLETLARRGPDEGRRRALRLLLGTGLIGGYTTYSTYALESVTLLGHGAVALGVAYALATLLAGAAATVGGIALGAGIQRRIVRVERTR